MTIFLIGCSKLNSPPSISPEFTSQTALNRLKELDESILALQITEYDRTHHGAFSQIFGGILGTDVQHFIQLRIKYFLNLLSPQSTAGITPPLGPHQNWLSYPLISFHPQLSLPKTHRENHFDSSQPAALNLSIQYWLQGLLDQKTYSIILSNGFLIPITQPREGVMSIGQQFSHHSTGEPHPPLVSQSILIHEARHSDCTGGISQSDLQHMKKAHRYEEFIRHHQSKTCGYLHELCPLGHPLSGIPACDSIPWGAYSVSAIFLESA